LVCTDAAGEAGYAQYERLDLAQVHVYDIPPGSGNTGHMVFCDASNVGFIRTTNSALLVPKKDDYSFPALTTSKWRIVFYAWK
jgi:hypothetical protein